MAYIKIFPITVTPKKAIDYITNPDKTDENILVSSFACSPETADLEFALTRETAKNMVMDKGKNLAFHLIQSFKPGEVDAETAHSLGQQFADEVLKGKYEYVISTHVDKDHIHNHIIFNAASFVDYHKYVSNKRSYHKICQISNKICQENGLATSMPTSEKGRCYKEDMEYKHGTSWKAKLKAAIDKTIWSSISYEEFLQKMKLAGYEVREGKHLSFRAPEQKNFTYMKSLGVYYSEESVLQRLEKNKHRTKTPKRQITQARLFIDISTYVTTGNREGFERWAKLNNLKEAAKTFNYLSENNLLNYEDFQHHMEDTIAAKTAIEQRMAEITSSISKEQQLQKQCEAYRSCRSVLEKGKNAKNLAQYKVKNAKYYELHKILKENLEKAGITKIPNVSHFQKKIENLQKEFNYCKTELNKLTNELSTLNIIINNSKEVLYTNNNLSKHVSINSSIQL